MIEFAVSLISQIGLLGAAFLIALEVIVPPIPSEAILLLTGFNVATGTFSFAGALFVTTLGSLLGATVLYLLGYFFTEERVERIIGRFGKYVGFPLKDLQRTMKWFERHGGALVFFGRMFPIVRSVVSVPAGLVRMGWVKFYSFSLLGILIWNSIWITIGFNLGENWEKGEQFAKYLDYVVYLLLGVVVLYLAINIVKFFMQAKDR